MQAEAGDLKSQLGAREQEVRELEGDITTAVSDVRDALHREVAALQQADDERGVRSRSSLTCVFGVLRLLSQLAPRHAPWAC